MLGRSRRGAIKGGDMVILLEGPFREFSGVVLAADPDGYLLIRLDGAPDGFLLRVHQRNVRRKTGHVGTSELWQ